MTGKPPDAPDSVGDVVSSFAANVPGSYADQAEALVMSSAITTMADARDRDPDELDAIFDALGSLGPQGTLTVVAAYWRMLMKSTGRDSDAAASIVIDSLAGVYSENFTEHQRRALLAEPRRWARDVFDGVPHAGKSERRSSADIIRLLSDSLSDGFPMSVTDEDREAIRAAILGPVRAAFLAPEIHQTFSERGPDDIADEAIMDIRRRAKERPGRGIGGIRGVARDVAMRRVLRSILEACGMPPKDADDATRQ